MALPYRERHQGTHLFEGVDIISKSTSIPLKASNTSSLVPSALGYLYGKATFLLELHSNSGAWYISTGTATTAAGGLAVQVDGATRYIQLFSTAPA